MKKIIGLLSFLLLFGATFALDGSFDIRMESDAGDYIGQGKSRHFTNENNDRLSFRKAYSRTDDYGYIFEVKSFSLGTPLTFSFEPEGGSFKKGNYYPAKRFPFNDDYNGISVSGDGRGCNTLLGGFYVHEFVMGDNDEIEKAAIDFVQYCGEGDAGLYGSLRYNSSVKSSCTSTACDGIAERIEDKKIVHAATSKTTTNSNTQVEHTEENLDMAIETLQLIQKKYPFFFAECIAPGILDESQQFMLTEGSEYFNVKACNGSYKNELAYMNKLLKRYFGEANSSDGEMIGGSQPSAEELVVMIRAFEGIIDRIDGMRSKLKIKGKLTDSVDILLASLSFFFEMAKLGIQIMGN